MDPAALPQPLVVLRARAEGAAGGAAGAPETTYYLLGTAHVSAESCDDVARLIRAVRPQVVLVELCAERRPILSADKASEPQQRMREGAACRRALLLPPLLPPLLLVWPDGSPPASSNRPLPCPNCLPPGAGAEPDGRDARDQERQGDALPGRLLVVRRARHRWLGWRAVAAAPRLAARAGVSPAGAQDGAGSACSPRTAAHSQTS